MTIPEHDPAYRVDWRTTKSGRWAHVTVAYIHADVVAAICGDPDGGPYTPEDLHRLVTDCSSRLQLTRMERLGDKRCADCMRVVATLWSGFERARRLWALEQLRTAIEALAPHAPIGEPAKRGRG